MTDSCVTNGINFLSSNVRILNEQVGSLIEPVGGSCCAVDERTITGSGLIADPLMLLTGQFPPNPQSTGFLRETIVATNPFNPLTQTNFEVEVPHTTSGYGIVMGIGHTYTVGAEGAVIGGGLTNSVSTAAANYATIAGGEDNTVESAHDVIAGGQNNTTLADHSAICGGESNTTQSDHGFVGGGSLNTAGASWSAIAGGSGNSVETGSNFGFIGGGQNNVVRNSAFSNNSAICGGFLNITESDDCFIGGGSGNFIGAGVPLNSGEAVICGGGGNTISGNEASQSFIGCGNQHVVNDGATKSVIVGGQNNQVGVVGANPAGQDFIALVGGAANRAYSQFTFVGGGNNNGCSGNHAVISGGDSNLTDGSAATVPGGTQNRALGTNSFAAGRLAIANFDGSFVWGDNSATTMPASVPNEVSFQAGGGCRIFSMSNLTTGVTLATGAGAWAAVSDKNLKANTKEVDNNEILDKLTKVPVYHYNYKTQEPDIKHIGVFAQDFHKQFGCGEKNTQIYTIDEAGVCIAAIKELHKQNLELREELNQLKQQIVN